MLVDTFDGFSLLKRNFMVRKGLVYNLALKLFGRLSSWKYLNKCIFTIVRALIFSASESDGRHIVAIFKKVKIHDKKY